MVLWLSNVLPCNQITILRLVNAIHPVSELKIIENPKPIINRYRTKCQLILTFYSVKYHISFGHSFENSFLLKPFSLEYRFHLGEEKTVFSVNSFTMKPVIWIYNSLVLSVYSSNDINVKTLEIRLNV